MDNIIKTIENSPIWEDLNNRCKTMYIEHSRIPSKEEYQALRNILICKVILEDPKVYKTISEYTYNELRRM